MEQDLSLQMSLQGTSNNVTAGPELGEKCTSRKFCFASLEADKPISILFSKVPAVFLCPPRAGDNHRAALAGPSLGLLRAPGPGFPVLHKVSRSGGTAGTGTPVMDTLGCASHGSFVPARGCEGINL